MQQLLGGRELDAACCSGTGCARSSLCSHCLSSSMAIVTYACGPRMQRWQFVHAQCSGHACFLFMGFAYQYKLIIFISTKNACQYTVHN